MTSKKEALTAGIAAVLVAAGVVIVASALSEGETPTVEEIVDEINTNWDKTKEDVETLLDEVTDNLAGETGVSDGITYEIVPDIHGAIDALQDAVNILAEDTTIPDLNTVATGLKEEAEALAETISEKVASGKSIVLPGIVGTVEGISSSVTERFLR